MSAAATDAKPQTLSWGACGPNTDGSPGCFQGQYSTYYVFWIGGSPKPTGITQACDCP